LLVLAVLLASGPIVSGQPAPQPARFDVASVKQISTLPSPAPPAPGQPAPAAPLPGDRLSIFTAVQEHLGLELESTRQSRSSSSSGSKSPSPD
jgi:hypothetical protein